MNAVLTIAAKDIRQRLRDRSVFIIAILAPLALAFVFNLVFGGVLGGNVQLSVGVVDADEGPVSDGFAGLVDSLEAAGLLDPTSYPDAAAARAAVDDEDVGAAFVLPEGLSARVRSGQSATMEVIGNVDASTTAAIASAIAERFAASVRIGALSAATALGAGVLAPDELEAAAAEAGMAPPPVAVTAVETDTRQLTGSTYYSAGLAIFFIFFIAGLAITSMLGERSGGTLPRLIAAPIPRYAVLAGKALASILVSLGAMAVLVIGTTLLIGADWGNPFGVAILVVCAVLAVTAIMNAIGSFARSAEQGANLQSVVGIVMAMLGGSFIPISLGNPVLAAVARLTPNAWFLDGLAELQAGNVADVLPYAGVLLLMAVVWTAIGLPFMRRAVAA